VYYAYINGLVVILFVTRRILVCCREYIVELYLIA
jgi:hypothetical protein